MINQGILVRRGAVIQQLAQLASQIPPNLANQFSLEQLQTIFRDMFSEMVWPQIVSRQQFEEKWDRLQKMYEVKRNPARPRQYQTKEEQTATPKTNVPTDLAETVIFDTVNRLQNLNYFIAWKEAPVQFSRPRHIFTPMEDEFYSPTNRKLQQANAILDWNNEQQQVRSKHLKLAQHHYLYGLSFTFSDFVMEIEADQSSDEFLLIKNIGTTFEPVSIRKLWLNTLLPINEMEKQVCPFFFDLQLRSTVQANQYDKNLNPFGFQNLEKLNTPTWLYGPEAKSFTDGLPLESRNLMTNMRPEFSGEALWTFYPILKLPGTQTAERYIVQCYANNLFSGGITPLRIQRLYYPRQRLPLYGCSHIPDLDSGLYTPSIGSILEAHYDELVRAKTQFLLNKDWINNPPTEYMTGSPAANVVDLNAPGAKYEVSSPNDVQRRVPYDATQSTIRFIEITKDDARTTGKAVDAILGKAMGGRTTATEASNAFQASMSGVTADVDSFCAAHYASYAIRVWENASKFLPVAIRDSITGTSDAPPLSDLEMSLNLGTKTDVGSTFIESIVKQTHFQEAIRSSIQSPMLDQAKLWKAYFRELKLPEALEAVKDNGFEFEVQLATEQAIQSYMGQPVVIDPSQDHATAMHVKKRFLQDHTSIYNTEMAANPSPMPGLNVAQYLAQQIAFHQQFAMLQAQQQMAMQVAAQSHQVLLNRAEQAPQYDPNKQQIQSAQ